MTVNPTPPTVRDALRAQLAEILYCDTTEIGDDTLFQNMGLDSVLSVELIASVNATYGLAEKAQAVRDHCTLNRLARYITQATGIAT